MTISQPVHFQSLFDEFADIEQGRVLLGGATADLQSRQIGVSEFPPKLAKLLLIREASKPKIFAPLPANISQKGGGTMEKTILPLNPPPPFESTNNLLKPSFPRLLEFLWNMIGIRKCDRDAKVAVLRVPGPHLVLLIHCARVAPQNINSPTADLGTITSMAITPKIMVE